MTIARTHLRLPCDRGWLVPMILVGVANSAWGQPSQQPFGTQLAPVHQAGTFHVATGTWLPLMTGMPGADVIYNNTIPTTLFGAMQPGQTWFFDGRVPSPTSPSIANFQSGCATQYAISGVQFGFCTDQPSVDIALDFYNQFQICASSHSEPLTATVSLSGLPGSSTPGSSACWIVTVDLAGSSMGFTLVADGDGTYDPPTYAGDQFACGVRFPALVGTATGPLLGGDVSGYILGTRWSVPVDYGAEGSGRNSDGFMQSLPTGECFDMHVALGLYLRLYSDACGPLAGGPYCAGDGSASACPCGNPSPALNDEGCRNSVNGVNGGRFEGTGTPSLAADSVVLKALRLPATTSTLFFQGTLQVNSGAGITFGDGLRCAGGTTQRLAARLANGFGDVQFPAPGDPTVSVLGSVLAPGTRTYQAWYRNSATFCTSAVFNLTNGWEISWQL